MRYFMAAALLFGVAACVPPPPDSERGVGFDSYDAYERGRAEREAALRRRATPPPQQISNETVASTPDPATGPAQTDPLTATRQSDTASARPGPAPANHNNPDISDEQEFGAVSGRESIESDRERLERQRQEYTIIAPKAVPTRRGSGAPNVVEFALATSNTVGQPIYKRSKVFASSRYRRNCAKYPSPDLAQLAFLQSGGPKRDSKGLDPDGDGFACFWDPAPFRNARK